MDNLIAYGKVSVARHMQCRYLSLYCGRMINSWMDSRRSDQSYRKPSRLIPAMQRRVSGRLAKWLEAAQETTTIDGLEFPKGNYHRDNAIYPRIRFDDTVM